MFNASHSIIKSCLLGLLFLLSGCLGVDRVSFKIVAPGIDHGTLLIKNVKGDVVYGGNIKAGRLNIANKALDEGGFYYLTINNDINKATLGPFEIYLQQGTYAINARGKAYPTIVSPSPAQADLSLYYNMIDMLRQISQGRSADSLQRAAKLPQAEIQVLTAEQVNGLIPDPSKATLTWLAKKNPESTVITHLIADLRYDFDPAPYYAIYNSLSKDAREAHNGKELGEHLKQLVKLAPGQPAPTISGLSPQGQSFKKEAYQRKIYLIEFWRTANRRGRAAHEKVAMENWLAGIPKKDDLGLISVSLDEKEDWWLSAIKEDGLFWPQYSDLKGNWSDNVQDWAIRRVPTYYLVDGNWRILDRDISLSEAAVVINQYLEHH